MVTILKSRARCEGAGDDGCPNKDRMGPYATEAEAASVLQRAAERNEAWDNDPDWNDDAND
jgi:hypothetical protein